MSDQVNNTPVTGSDSNRTLAIMSYILLLVGWPTGHMASVGGVILAYVQRGEARGTVWESHYEAIISTFWITLVVFVVAIPLCFIIVGIPLMMGILIWSLYRVIRGLVHALDSKPY